jgi:hypothetical protein
MKDEFGPTAGRSVRSWIDRRFALFRPTMLVFCRYGGPQSEPSPSWRAARNPVVYPSTTTC